MADSKCSLPEAWKNGELTADTIGRRHERLLPDVADLEKDLTAVGKSIDGYIDALNNYCSAGCRVSATFAKLLGDTTLSKISQQFQQVTDKLEHKVLNDCNADISSSVLTTLSEFTSLLPAVKKEIGDYKRCKNRHSKCQETLESFAQKDVAASEGKRFQQVKERFSWADRDYTQKQEQLSQCLSSLEGNRIKVFNM
jgi:6-pyruvoyl-tetrahydropterin synthase